MSDSNTIMDTWKAVSYSRMSSYSNYCRMVITMFWNDKGKAEAGIKWTSKLILQAAVVLLGFGMNLAVIFKTGKQSLPIIICTITTSLVIAWILQRLLKVHTNSYTCRCRLIYLRRVSHCSDSTCYCCGR